jgi:hypothetical protein
VGTYRLWPSTNGPASPAGDTTVYTLGVEFYATSLVDFTGWWWWCAPGADPAAKTFGLWTVDTAFTGTLVATAAGSALTQGTWNYAALSPVLQLTANQRYRAGVLGGGNGANWYGATANGWPVDLANGPLHAPSTANAVGNLQGSYKQAAVLSFPRDTGSSNYWLDVQVMDAAAPPTAARTLAKGREPAHTASGRRATGLVKGREPVFSTRGEQP